MVLPKDSLISPRSYPTGELGDNFGEKDPFERFKEWFEYAIEQKVIEPDALTLSTIGKSGVNARTLVLRGISEKGLLIYTNYESNKAQEIENNNNVAITFYWKEIYRQVRIKARATKTTQKQSDEYFASRPRGAQIGAWISSQSKTLSSRGEMLEAYEKLDSISEDKIERPKFWGGYELIPYEWEFMLGHENRLHDRFKFIVNPNGSFSSQRLWP